jgi:hypothetical protein
MGEASVPNSGSSSHERRSDRFRLKLRCHWGSGDFSGGESAAGGAALVSFAALAASCAAI